MSKHPRKSHEADVREDLLLYLFAEVERVIERDSHQWNADTARIAQERAVQIAAKVQKRAADLEVG